MHFNNPRGQILKCHLIASIVTCGLTSTPFNCAPRIIVKRIAVGEFGGKQVKSYLLTSFEFSWYCVLVQILEFLEYTWSFCDNHIHLRLDYGFGTPSDLHQRCLEAWYARHCWRYRRPWCKQESLFPWLWTLFYYLHLTICLSVCCMLDLANSISLQKKRPDMLFQAHSHGVLGRSQTSVFITNWERGTIPSCCKFGMKLTLPTLLLIALLSFWKPRSPHQSLNRFLILWILLNVNFNLTPQANRSYSICLRSAPFEDLRMTAC